MAACEACRPQPRTVRIPARSEEHATDFVRQPWSAKAAAYSTGTTADQANAAVAALHRKRRDATPDEGLRS